MASDASPPLEGILKDNWGRDHEDDQDKYQDILRLYLELAELVDEEPRDEEHRKDDSEAHQVECAMVANPSPEAAEHHAERQEGQRPAQEDGLLLPGKVVDRLAERSRHHQGAADAVDEDLVEVLHDPGLLLLEGLGPLHQALLVEGGAQQREGHEEDELARPYARWPCPKLGLVVMSASATRGNFFRWLTFIIVVFEYRE